jgi:hypothetical protein
MLGKEVNQAPLTITQVFDYLKHMEVYMDTGIGDFNMYMTQVMGSSVIKDCGIKGIEEWLGRLDEAVQSSDKDEASALLEEVMSPIGFLHKMKVALEGSDAAQVKKLLDEEKGRVDKELEELRKERRNTKNRVLVKALYAREGWVQVSSMELQQQALKLHGASECRVVLRQIVENNESGEYIELLKLAKATFEDGFIADLVLSVLSEDGKNQGAIIELYRELSKSFNIKDLMEEGKRNEILCEPVLIPPEAAKRGCVALVEFFLREGFSPDQEYFNEPSIVDTAIQSDNADMKLMLLRLHREEKIKLGDEHVEALEKGLGDLKAILALEKLEKIYQDLEKEFSSENLCNIARVKSYIEKGNKDCRNFSWLKSDRSNFAHDFICHGLRLIKERLGVFSMGAAYFLYDLIADNEVQDSDLIKVVDSLNKVMFREIGYKAYEKLLSEELTKQRWTDFFLYEHLIRSGRVNVLRHFIINGFNPYAGIDTHMVGVIKDVSARGPENGLAMKVMLLTLHKEGRIALEEDDVDLLSKQVGDTVAKEYDKHMISESEPDPEKDREALGEFFQRIQRSKGRRNFFESIKDFVSQQAREQDMSLDDYLIDMIKRQCNSASFVELAFGDAVRKLITNPNVTDESIQQAFVAGAQLLGGMREAAEARTDDPLDDNGLTFRELPKIAVKEGREKLVKFFLSLKEEILTSDIVDEIRKGNNLEMKVMLLMLCGNGVDLEDSDVKLLTQQVISLVGEQGINENMPRDKVNFIMVKLESEGILKEGSFAACIAQVIEDQVKKAQAAVQAQQDTSSAQSGGKRGVPTAEEVAGGCAPLSDGDTPAVTVGGRVRKVTFAVPTAEEVAGDCAPLSDGDTPAVTRGSSMTQGYGYSQSVSQLNKKFNSTVASVNSSKENVHIDEKFIKTLLELVSQQSSQR